jgi:hypothetical protein
MSTEDVSLISRDKFIQKFVHSIILNIRAKKFNYNERHVIHADLVPRMHSRVMEASLREGSTARTPAAAPIQHSFVPPKRNLSALVTPIRMPTRTLRPQPVPRAMPVMNSAPVAPARKEIQMPAAPPGATLSQDYGKLTPLLSDPSVSTIECAGASKPLTIIRAGQKQMTRINLNVEEIKEFLQKISDIVHIPLLEGVFRAAVDNFSVNAVISEIIGSRFIIKKQTAYSMLE